jgi:hypothetical protein
MNKRTLIIATVISAAAISLVNAQPTPTGVAVGPWRTGVAVTCADGRTIPARTAISGPNVTAAELCGSGSSTTTSSSGAMISNTGNFAQDTLTNSVNLAIVMRTTNPLVSGMMQGAATGFISSLFANNAEAQRQQALMAQEILRRQQEQALQARIAQQQRIDAMFARLNSELKLEGVPFKLSLKSMNSSTPDSLQLKGMNSPGPSDLKLKITDASPTAYGLKGLPGLYVGGPAGADANAANPSLAANSGGGESADASGNPNVVSGPGTGTTGPGIPGLPGIYLDGVQPSQAKQLAQAAQTMSGPEREVAQDTALRAAQSNPALATSSPDPAVDSFQQNNQDYQKALAANTAASQDLQTAQAHVEADKSALDVARGQLAAITPSLKQQEAFNQMIAAAKTDEEASMLARQNFDSTAVQLAVTRDRAATALAQTTSPALTVASKPNFASAPASTATRTQAAPSPSSSTVDLTHAVQPITTALLRPAVPRGGPILPSPAVTRPVDIDACLAAATHSSAPHTRPTVDQLRAQLDIAKESLTRLLETHNHENEDRADWAKEMKKGGIDIGYQAFDLTAKFVLGHYAENAKEEAKWAEDGFNRAQESLKTETDVARQASHAAEIAAFRQERADAEQARELLESTKDGAAQGAAVRDLRGYIKDHPVKESENGSIVPTLEGVKQLIKIGLGQETVQKTLERWAAITLKTGQMVPFVDRTVAIGGAVIDTGYDLTVEYLGFYQLQQADQNSELFYRGAAPLQKKIQTTVDQLKCFL